MADDQYVANLRQSAMMLGMVVLSLQDFAALVIGRAHAGGALDDAALDEIRSVALDNLRNSEAGGLPIKAEADAFGQALVQLDQLIVGAIKRGRDLAEG